MAKIEFIGAAGTVTGSKTLLRFTEKPWLLDCGLFQGPKELRDLNWATFKPAASTLERVILTHAHLDHSGFLPRLFKQGFQGEVLCTSGTRDLCEILLRDSAKLQEEDSDYANETGHSHHKPALPLYSTEDVEGVLDLFDPVARDVWIPLSYRCSVRFLRAGHIPGASVVQFSISDSQKSKIITFTGDLGHDRSLLLKPPQTITETDVLVVESTYGSRIHDRGDGKWKLKEVINEIHDTKGVLLIPAFAVGRAQEILYLIRTLENEGSIPQLPVVLDSPMSTEATKVFLKHAEDHRHELNLSSQPELLFPAKFQTACSTDESMMFCMQDGPMIVISASGMLSGGRILHHLKKRLPQEKNIVLFVGYQAEGSKGRYLQDIGAQEGKMRIHHVEIPVRARIETLPSLSAHGDVQDILDWMGHLTRKPEKIFINHGSTDSALGMADAIRNRFGWESEAVCPGTEYSVFGDGA